MPLSTANKVWYRFNMYYVSLLINSRTQEKFDYILLHVAICLLHKTQVKTRSTPYGNWSMQWKNENKSLNMLKWMESSNVDDDNVDLTETDRNTTQNPFKNHYENLIRNVKKRAMEDAQHSKPNNRCYAPEFFAFIESYLCEMPLWSGVPKFIRPIHRGERSSLRNITRLSASFI